jgi:hypothetical protein
MRVLVGCECSGVVREAFRACGHDAWSCDLKPTEQPGNHLQCDVLTVLDDGWDLMIAHPDCTYLTISAEWAYKDPDCVRYPGVGYHMKLKAGTLTGAARRAARDEAAKFFRTLLDCRIPRVCLENPVGCISSRVRKPDQTIQPHQYGEDASKATCLWLRNLPPLKPTGHFPPRMVNGRPRWGNQTDGGQNKLSPSANRVTDRSRTYEGIARAMADQWGRPAESVEQPSLFTIAG